MTRKQFAAYLLTLSKEDRREALYLYHERAGMAEDYTPAEEEPTQ